jgi:hypothetical protein
LRFPLKKNTINFAKKSDRLLKSTERAIWRGLYEKLLLQLGHKGLPVHFWHGGRFFGGDSLLSGGESLGVGGLRGGVCGELGSIRIQKSGLTRG